MTKIVFNGQEYASVEAMPEDVRRAYAEALAMFKDRDGNGIPDLLEPGGADKEIRVHQSSFAFHGPEEVEGAMRRLLVGDEAPERPSRRPAPLEQMQRQLEGMLRILLGIAAVAVLLGALAMMASMDAGSRSQGGRLYVAVGALVALGFLDSQFARLERRRESFLIFETDEFRRFRLRSALLLVLSGLLLLGFACLWP